MTRDELRRLCEKDLAVGHDRPLTTREVALLEDWAFGTIRRWVYEQPPVLASIRVGQGTMQIPRVRVPYSETLRVFHPDWHEKRRQVARRAPTNAQAR